MDPVHDLPPELLQAGWRKFWSRRQNRPYFFNQVTNESLWEMPILNPVTVENFYKELRISICSILGSVPEETVAGIYHAIQNAGFESISDLNLVQEDDLMCILKPIPRRKLIKLWSKSCMIKESMCKCEKMKNEEANRQINEFLAETRNFFEYSTHTVTMDDLLKTNISRILNSVSEETVNNIIHALKYAGLEFLLDLHFVREDDLIQVLKPCQRRKLIKAWSQQGIRFLYSSASAVIDEHHNTHEGSNSVSSLLPNNASSSIPDLSMLAQIQARVGSSHMDTSQPLANELRPYMDLTYHSLQPELPPRVSSFTDHSPLPSASPPGVSCFTAHGPLLPGSPPRDPRFTGVSHFGLLSGVSHFGLLSGVSRFTDYGSLPLGPPSGVPDLTGQDALPPGPPPGVPDLTDQDPLPPGFPPRGPGLTDQDPLPPGPPPGVTDQDPLPPLPPGPPPVVTDQSPLPPLPPGPPPVVTDQSPLPPGPPSRVPDLTDQNPLPHEPPPKVSSFISIDKNIHSVTSSNLPPEKFKWNRSKHHLLLQVCAKHRKELSHPTVKKNHQIWRKIAEEFSQRFLKCPKDCKRHLLISESECMYKIEMLRDEYHALKDKEVLGRSKFFKTARAAFECGNSDIHSITSSNLPPEKFKWNRSQHHLLLQVCAKHRKELSHPTVKKNRQIWRKIAEEFSRRFLKCPKDCKRHLLISESECMDKIEMLRDEYHALKDKEVLGRSKFFKTARAAFECGNSVTTIAELPSCPSLPSFKWTWNKRLALLRLYAIFKTEFSSSIINKQSVWEKIAEKVGSNKFGKCDAKQCQNQIKSMKFDYEESKHKKPYELKVLQTVLLDEAENAFENSENPVVFSVQSHLEEWTMRKPDCAKLLQVYSKYKEELSLQNFDVENQIVWGKVSREISKKYSAYYGKRRCFYEINNLKQIYESFIKNNRRTYPIPDYFFDEAKKAFESTECSVQLGETNSLKDITVKQEKETDV